MSDFMKEFDKPDFDPEKFADQLVKECVGGADLLQKKNEIQAYYENISATLKKTVYENYTQFIDAAKEISHLESEMYQLSHILIEQRNLLSTLIDDNVDEDKKHIGDTENTNEQSEEKSVQEKEDIESKNAARAVKETGYNGNLEGKTFLKEGALIELDANDYRPIQRVFFFLFNDVLVVCKVKHDKRLQFSAEFDPKKIAVINIKDLDGVKNAINIITPDFSKIYQSVTPAGKTEWIEKFEEAFRFDQVLKSKSKKRAAPQPPSAPKPESPGDTKSLLSDLSPNDENMRKAQEKYAPEWVAIASEEIQTLIALRHFEDAQAYIKRTQEYIRKDNSFVNAKEIEEKVKTLENNLTTILLQELSKWHNRDLQIMLRASRRSLKLLVDELGHARQAATTLLKVCSAAIRTAQREARRSNAEIAELFFCDLAQVACEFLTVFEGKPACVSALVVWCNAELQYFASQLIKHYLTKGTQLEAVAKCIESIREPCSKLTEIGLDLAYHIEGLLRTTLEQLMEESRVRLLETGRTEDTWQPYNLQTKMKLKQLLIELDALGLDLRSKTTGDTWINLTQSTVVFSRYFLQLTEHCACLAKSEVLAQSAEILLRDFLIAQQAIKPTSGTSVDPNFVVKNKLYLFEELLPIAMDKYTKISGRQCDILKALYQEFRKQQTPVPKQRSVYQTDVF